MTNTTPNRRLGLQDTDDGDSINFTRHVRRHTNPHESLGVPKCENEELNKEASNRSLSNEHTPEVTDPFAERSYTASSSNSLDKPMPTHPPAKTHEFSPIFHENLVKPAPETTLDVPLDRIEKTEQLIYYNTLLRQSEKARNTTEIRTQMEPTLTDKELEWLAKIEKDPMEKVRIRWLATCMVEEFVQGGAMDSIEIAEIVALGPVLDRESYRKLLSHFISLFESTRILNTDILQGLVQLVQSASLGYLVSDDLVKIFSVFKIRLQGTYQHSLEHSFYLTQAVSQVLDAMADQKAKGLNRVEEHELIYEVLLKFTSRSNPYLMYQVCYAIQALQHVFGDETPLEALLHHSTGVIGGFKLDIASILEGLGHLEEKLGRSTDTLVNVYEGVCSLLESGRVDPGGLKDHPWPGQKRPWYPAIRAAYAFAQAGQLKDLNQLIYEAPCRCDPLFQWGICQLLGETASNAVWNTSVCQRIIKLLGELYKNDNEWGQDSVVKTWVLHIITQFCSIDGKVIDITSHTLYKELEQEQDIVSSLPSLLNNWLHLPRLSPTLARVQNITYVEYELHKLREMRLEEHRRGIYVPLQAKPNMYATDGTLFPLMEKALELLSNRSRCQVLLLLGDSGAGKSTFSLELEHTLWKNYDEDGPVPLYINLSYIDNPAQELIEKQLQYYNFSTNQIQEMKLRREVLLICDGYDESQLRINIHSTNRFNQPGQWKVKMVVSCRSQYLGQDYHLWFQPQPIDRYQPSMINLFQEAMLVEFSRNQIQQYVEEYVKEQSPADPPQDRLSWDVNEYMDKLVNIPNLMDLVSNPFLLTLALEALPSVVPSKMNLSMIRITRVRLYDSFVKRWLKVNRMRLEQIPLSMAERSELDLLTSDNFLYHAIQFQKDLSTAIFMEHNGNPVIKYIPLRDKGTWKASFFAAEGQAKLLRESSTVMRTGAFFRFLHRSLLEYFYSRTIYDPHDYDTDVTANDRQPTYDPKTCLAQMSIVDEPSIVQFLAERVTQDASFQQQLLEVIEKSKANASVATAASNAITILVKTGVNFNSADLRSANIPKADLSEGQFDSAQFQGANLTEVNLSKSWLRQADMSDALMEGVRFGEFPYLEMDNFVSFCAYSPDGRMLGAAVGNGIIYIYDTSAWRRIHCLSGHSDVVNSIAFSPDSQRLVSGSNDKSVRLWDTSSGEELLIMLGHSHYVKSVTVSPCGNQIASAGNYGTVRLWDVQAGKWLPVLEGHGNVVTSVKYSPDGYQLISGSLDGTIRFWDVRTGEPGIVLSPSLTGVHCVAYSPDGRWVAAGHLDGHLQIWDAVSLKPGSILRGHTQIVTGIDFSSSGGWIASSSYDMTVRLWDVSTGALLTVLTGHNNPVLYIAISLDDHQLVSAGDDRKVRVWGVDISWSRPDLRNGGRIVELAYSRDSRSVLSCDEGGLFRQWDAATGICTIMPFEVPEQEAITTRTCTLDGSQLAFGYNDGSIRFWNCQTDTAGPILKSYSMRINALFYSPCCRWIISVDQRYIVRLWDLHSAQPQPHIVDINQNLDGVVRDVAFSSTGGQFAIGAHRGSIYLFDTQSRESLGRMKLEEAIWSLTFSPNDKQIAIGTGIGMIYLWDLNSKDISATLDTQEEWIQSIAYSPCGQWIASESSNMIRIWHRQLSDEAESWSRVDAVCGLFGYVGHVAWNPLIPMELVTGCQDGSIQAWKMSFDESGKVIFKMVWGASLGTLCTQGAIFTNAVGLDPIYQKLLLQRDAICSSDKPTFPHG